ncbi:ATP-binding cassette domain-containing protein [Anaeromyxobacter sp. PSR-1]|uniref:ATP-binding cassette domain-containing protein n=1 Tax=unclassified Anaeromyxobacter TaxID=2620896 RepID=UPI0005E9E03F|nr:ATP-binding cassette domain-containing protein [Anaeromyxobacter sp. PSR-1]GAO01420.1 glycine betaine/carnitine/choline transport ATP-binding protein OpuCA [Anaeromyxobacter sp. PSR-1]
MAQPVLELHQVTKRFRGPAAIGPVSLTVSRGEAVALLGPSGAGKSTLLRMALGLLRPDDGEVRFLGAPIGPADHAARRGIGYVVQGGGLFPHLTAAANTALVARHLGWPAERVRARLAELAALARLPADALERHPGALSSGQAQRVSLIRALMLDPELLVLDEPLGALDPITRAGLQEDLRTAFRAVSKTVVLVTHDLAEAAFLADRLVLLRDGQVVQAGTLEDLARNPTDPFVARFVGAHRTLVLPEAR